jgi:hypothetical protein
MATDSPLIRDGAQNVASANYASYVQQYCAVSISGSRSVTLTGAGAASYGILQNKPAQGQAADVGLLGPSKGQAGAAFSAGVALMSNASGQLIAWSTGSYIVAYSIEAATAAAQIVTVYVLPTNKA